MKQIHVIHLVESRNRHDWLEKLIEQLRKNGISQSLITLESDGEIKDFLSHKYPNLHLVGTHKKRLGVLTGVMEILGARKKDSLNLVFALGHPAAFIAAVASLFPDVKFIFSHMQQPNYFKLMIPRWKGAIHNLVYNLYIARASLIHSLSAEVTEFLIKKGIDRKKIFNINIGVNFGGIREKLTSEDKSIIVPPGFPILLMVGRLAPEKNYGLALKTFAMFLDKHPKSLLLIAGVGPQENELKILAKDLEIIQSVRFLGYVGNVPWLMTRADVLLHLATTESYGQIYLEAILSELSVVCSRTGVAIDLQKAGVPDVFIVKELSVNNVIQTLELCLDKIPVFRSTDNNPFYTFREHDEKFVHEKICESFAGFQDLGDEAK
jgi:glycosyltransferase involved in cell wall biosynthesis